MGNSGAKGLGFLLFFLLLHVREDVLHVLIFLELVDELSEGLTLLWRHRLVSFGRRTNSAEVIS